MTNSFKLPLIVMSLAATAISASATAPTVAEMQKFVLPANQPVRPTSFTYMPDGETYLMLSDDHRSIIRYNIRSGEKVEVLVDLASTRENQLPAIDGFTISADASKVMVWCNVEPVYRRSFKAAYYIYDTHSRILRPLSKQFAAQQEPVFSPNSRMVAFVAENNIYVAKLDYQTEVAVTTDGKINSVINGLTDWVYEEEFTTTRSMAWSPDDLTLSFLKYDESEVPTYDMQTYCGAYDSQKQYLFYPGTWSYKYPVAGEANSKISLHSYDVETRKTKDIALPDKRIEYIPKLVYGADAESLLVATLNRDQNHYEIYKVNPKSTVAKSVYVEDSQSWISPCSYESLYVNSTGFVVNSWKSGYHELYIYNFNGVETGRIALDNCDITAYYGSDAAGTHYYQAAYPTPLDRTVRCLDRKGKTTDLSPASGTSSATFSPDMRYMMLQHNSTTQPPVYTLNTAAGKAVRTIEDNAAYASRFSGKVCKREFFTMQSGRNTLNGYIVKPTDFSASKKYPVVMYQYSGPQSQEVLNRWQVDWQDVFARAGYVVVCVDGRGTGGRGREFCDVVYRDLGNYETVDQIAAAEYAASLPYVDANRIGIFGWSYGGYEALMAITADNNPYKAAVAVAPVTDWRFYDTVYAERFMLTPQQNEDGYFRSAPLNRYTRVNCPLLIMYGTADDNVHPANSLEFVSRLQASGSFCDMFVFPNKNHSIYGGNARAVVYGKMLDWFNKNL